MVLLRAEQQHVPRVIDRSAPGRYRERMRFAGGSTLRPPPNIHEVRLEFGWACRFAPFRTVGSVSAIRSKLKAEASTVVGGFVRRSFA